MPEQNRKHKEKDHIVLTTGLYRSHRILGWIRAYREPGGRIVDKNIPLVKEDPQNSALEYGISTNGVYHIRAILPRRARWCTPRTVTIPLNREAL